MKKSLLFFATLCLFTSCDTLLNTTGGYPSAGVTEQEASTGIRQALTQGVSKGITYLNHTDGFFGNETYKLFLPPEAQKIENVLRTIGLGSQVDKAILQINRAAEDA